MKKIYVLLQLSLIIFIISGCAEKQKPEITAKMKNDIRQDAKQFMVSLKDVLVREMQTNGIAAAVSVCSDTAQILTNNYGKDKGIYIKRVSFKNRNPQNVPDDFEAEGLRYFEGLKKEGKLTEESEIIDIIQTEETTNVRYLKPILVQAPCLNCHGTEEMINPDVKLLIANKYPQDKATGYQLSDLRGAVSIKKVL